MNEKQVKQTINKLKALKSRIYRIEAAIKMANDYLRTGEHAEWHGFRPLYVGKFKDGKPCPPPTDWVKNVFLRDCLRQLMNTDKVLRRLEAQVYVVPASGAQQPDPDLKCKQI